MPRLHPAGMFLLIAFLAMSWIFRKSFCGWLCPVGTISEYLWRLGRQAFGRNFRLPRKLDVGLRSLKYILLGLFLYAVAGMSVMAIREFLEGPYGLVDDVKMLNFFRTLGVAGGAVMALLVVGSVLVQNLWCRYLCPYGALMGLAAVAGPLQIRRRESLCIDCAKCAKACPAGLPVDRLAQIRSSRMHRMHGMRSGLPGGRRADAGCSTPPARAGWAVAAGVAAIFLGICGYAQWTGHWGTELPRQAVFGAGAPRQRVHSPVELTR